LNLFVPTDIMHSSTKLRNHKFSAYNHRRNQFLELLRTTARHSAYFEDATIFAALWPPAPAPTVRRLLSLAQRLLIIQVKG